MTAIGITDKVNIASIATRSSVASTTTDVLLLEANPSRISAIIFNDADSPLYVGFGTVPVTTEEFSMSVPAKTVAVLPVSFTGQIRGVWSITSGFARITEIK